VKMGIRTKKDIARAVMLILDAEATVEGQSMSSKEDLVELLMKCGLKLVMECGLQREITEKDILEVLDMKLSEAYIQEECEGSDEEG